jgi:WD40 repeat protein
VKDPAPQVSAGKDGKLIVWDTAARGQRAVLAGHGEGSMVTNAQVGGGLVPWRPLHLRFAVGCAPHGARVQPARPAATQVVSSLAATPEGHLVSGSWDQTARVWGTAAPDGGGFNYMLESAGASPPASPPRCAARSPEPTEPPGAAVARLEPHGAAVLGVAALPSGLLATACGDGTVRLWDGAGACVKSCAGHKAPVRAIAAAPEEVRPRTFRG